MEDTTSASFDDSDDEQVDLLDIKSLHEVYYDSLSNCSRILYAYKNLKRAMQRKL